MNIAQCLAASLRIHMKRPAILALVLSGSLATFYLMLKATEMPPDASVLAMQWGPIPLDLAGNFYGWSLLEPVTPLILILRITLTSWVLSLLLQTHLNSRIVLGVAAVYLLAAALFMGLIFGHSAFILLFIGIENPPMILVWALGLVGPLATIVLMGALLPLLVRQFSDDTSGEFPMDLGYWAVILIAYLLWFAADRLAVLWLDPQALGYGLAFCILALQSLMTGTAILRLLEHRGGTRIGNRPTFLAAADSSISTRQP